MAKSAKLQKPGNRARGGQAAPPSLSITDDARRWVAENLLLGAKPEHVAGRLQIRGCPRDLAWQEVEAALASPYFRGAELLRQRLGKRDWLLASYGRLAAIDGGLAEVPRAHALPAQKFFRDYYAAHRPVILTGLLDGWPATTSWSLDYLDSRLGDVEIEVQAGRTANANYEMEAPAHRTRLPLAQVTAKIRNEGPTNDFYVTAGNGSVNRAALAPLWDDIGPLPGYLDPTAEADGFFWMGPQGTVTPFHHDLTNNLLVQICGRKKIVLVPSWDTPLMRNFRHCYSGLSGPEALQKLPADERPHAIECVLAPGEALFIPVGWWHHVEGFDSTIGLSFVNFTRENDFVSSYSFYDQI